MGPAVARAAPPVETELELALALALLELESELEVDEESEEEVVAVEVPVLLEDPVLLEPVEEPLRVAVDRVLLTPATGEDRPAGMEAAGCCEVTTAGWLVTTEA
jgi:hypothetical protein